MAPARLGRFNLSPSEAVDIANGDGGVTGSILRRECPTVNLNCTASDLKADAAGQAMFVEMTGAQSIAGLRNLITDLRPSPGRKMVVLVSGGLISTDRAGGRSDLSHQISGLARDVAMANVSIFALHLDWSFIVAHTGKGGIQPSIFRDGNLAATGLERIVGTTGGTMFRVYGTDPETAFTRVITQSSALYELGVATNPTDFDGNPKVIRVRVNRCGVQVHHRQVAVLPRR